MIIKMENVSKTIKKAPILLDINIVFDYPRLLMKDKSFLGDKSLRAYGDSASESKMFIEFIALIIRNRIYTYLKNAMKAVAKRPDFMTVPAALRELDRIKMIRLTDNKYRLNHAVTAHAGIFDVSVVSSLPPKARSIKPMTKFCDTLRQKTKKTNKISNPVLCKIDKTGFFRREIRRS